MPGMPATSLKRNRDFRLLLRGSSASMLGSRVSAIAYPLLVLAMTGSPVVAGCVGFAIIAPSILVYLPAGALVDRWDPRRAMLGSEIGRGAATATIVLVLALGRLTVVDLVVLGAMEQILEDFSSLAERRLVRSLVERSQATSALARSEARTHVVVLAGRPLGGLLFGLGRIFPFVADVFSFAVSASALVLIGKGRGTSHAELAASPRLGRETGDLAREIREAMRWLRLHPFAGIALQLGAGASLVSQALIMVFVAEADAQHLSPLTIGLVLAASGAGGALGSAMASRLFSLAGYYLLPLQMGVWMVTLGLLAWAGGRSYQAMAVAMAAMGFTGALGNIALDTYVIRNAAETMLARVTSVDRLTTFGALAVGPPLGGILFGFCGARNAIWALLTLTACLLLAAFLASRKSPASSSAPARSSAALRQQAQPVPDLQPARQGPAAAHPGAGRGLGHGGRAGHFLRDRCQGLLEEQGRAAMYLHIVMALLGPAYLIALQERHDARRQS
jgi:MFS family permease